MKRLSDSEKRTKMEILEELKAAMNADMDPLEPKQEVTVMAEEPEALVEGLDMAKDMVEDEDMLPALEDLDSEDDEMSEDASEMSKEEIEAEMERLQAMLERME